MADADKWPVGTQSEAARDALTAAIVGGGLAPGSRLGVRELARHMNIGPTPLREALSGLAGRGLVTFSGQRGFRVASASKTDLHDIVVARNVIESGALRLSIEHGDREWEVSVVAALHRLRMFFNDAPEGASEQIEQFEHVNRVFHVTLISACGSDRLLNQYVELFEQTRRYRSLALSGRSFDSDAFEAHARLAQLCVARNVEGACAALLEHNSLLLRLI